MNFTGTTTVVDFDAEAALEAAASISDAEVLIGVEYNTEAFNILYVSDVVDTLYQDREQMTAHFDTIHSYVHLDFTERELFKDLFVDPAGVRAFVTYMGNMIAIRLLSGDDGLFIGLAPGSAVTGVVTSVEAAVKNQ
ncbi:hypothetical protein [Haladaptatus sp. DJG-WS-42]|uniref:hypothetical protein n=1 Tax=Haladaptatus sp. DJG-WS-42 TaxID=3120516 RepID=UPI0030CAB7F5